MTRLLYWLTRSWCAVRGHDIRPYVNDDIEGVMRIYICCDRCDKKFMRLDLVDTSDANAKLRGVTRH